MLTKEELAARLSARRAKKKALATKLPPSGLFEYSEERGIWIELEKGCCRQISIRWRGDWLDANNRWGRAHVYLDVEKLGEFISALVARYNYMIGEMNRVASTSRMAAGAEVGQYAINQDEDPGTLEPRQTSAELRT